MGPPEPAEVTRGGANLSADPGGSSDAVHGEDRACVNLQDLAGRFLKIGENEIVVAVSVPWGAEEKRRCACHVCRLGVLPLVAHDKRAFEIEMPFEAGFDEQAGFGLAAWTAVCFVVGADQDVVKWQPLFQEGMHQVHVAARLIAARNAGLVGRADEDEACLAQLAQREQRFAVEVKFVHGERRHLVVAFGADEVQNSISFEEHSGFHVDRGLSRKLAEMQDA